MPQLSKRRLLKNTAIVNDEWTLAPDTDGAIPEGKVIVSLDTWQQQKDSLISRGKDSIGVVLQPDQSPKVLADDLDKLALVAINFPTFMDGRGYSYARELREHYKFEGEIRAIGDVLKDQLFFLKRCGFDAYKMRDDIDIEEAANHLHDFSKPYQAAVDEPQPLLHR